MNYKEYQRNPAKWIKDVLDDNPRWSKQTEIIESVRDNRNTYVKSCHGVGKTFSAKDVALWFLMCHYPSKVITTAPSWAQVEKLLWSEINSAYNKAKYPLGGRCLRTELKINDDWFAIGISPKMESEDDGKRMTGYHSENLLVIFDEAPAVNAKLWDIKETLMTSENVRFLGIGNPVQDSGHFYEGFKSESVNKISMNIFDSPNFKDNNIKNIKDLVKLSRMPVKEREKLFSKYKYKYKYLTTVRWAVERLLDWGLDSPIFQSRVLGEFPKTSTDTIIALASLEACKDAEVKGNTVKVLGVDVARFGSDYTCMYGYENYKPIYKEKWNGQDLVKTANIIKHKIEHESYQVIVIDDTGLGGGITDMINDFLSEKSYSVEVMAVNYAEASGKEEYDGIVTEMYYNAKDMIESKDVVVEDNGKLFSELCSRKYKFTNKGKIKIEPKDEFKKRTGLSSPDEADSFIMCMWGISHSKSMFTIEEVGSRTFAQEVEDDETGGDRVFKP